MPRWYQDPLSSFDNLTENAEAQSIAQEVTRKAEFKERLIAFSGSFREGEVARQHKEHDATQGFLDHLMPGVDRSNWKLPETFEELQDALSGKGSGSQRDDAASNSQALSDQPDSLRAESHGSRDYEVSLAPDEDTVSVAHSHTSHRSHASRHSHLSQRSYHSIHSQHSRAVSASQLSHNLTRPLSANTNPVQIGRDGGEWDSRSLGTVKGGAAMSGTQAQAEIARLKAVNAGLVQQLTHERLRAREGHHKFSHAHLMNKHYLHRDHDGLFGAQRDSAPRLELRSGCWLVEGFVVGHHPVSNDAYDVFVRACGATSGERDTPQVSGEICSITVEGETRFLSIETCTNTAVAVDFVSTGLLVRDCTRIILHIAGDTPPITLINCVGVEIVFGEGSFANTLDTINCTGVVWISVPQRVPGTITQHELAERAALNVPTLVSERMTTTLKNGAMYTVCRADASSMNAAFATMGNQGTAKPSGKRLDG